MEACHHKALIAMLGTIISWKPMFMFLMKNCTLLLVLKQCCNRLFVATLASSSWPKQRGYKVAGQKEGSPGIKAKALQGFRPSHLDVGSVANHRVYYKGEGGGFPPVRVVVNLVCPCCPWLVLAPRVLQLCTNHFVWVVCRPMWVSEACQLFLVPSQSSNTPLYPSKCCELRSVPWLLPLLPCSIWTHIWVL